MTNISKLAWTGVARESAPGTAASTPTMYIPVKKSTWERKTKMVYMSEERATRDGNNRRKATVRMSAGDVAGEVYLQTIPYILLGFMGGVASTQPDSGNAPTAYSHALTLADVPPGLTFFKGFDHTGQSMAYSAISKLKLKFDANAKTFEWAPSPRWSRPTPTTKPSQATRRSSRSTPWSSIWSRTWRSTSNRRSS
jgi:hypothetical protein